MNGKSEPLLADFPDSSLHLDLDNREALQQVAQQIRQKITTAQLPPEWGSTLVDAAQQWHSPTLILRPSLSLPHSDGQEFVGLLQSHVCLCQLQAMEIALKKTWAELFRARSLFCAQQAGIGLEELNLAILVQPIANVIASGTGKISPESWNIQATWGLGHSLVRGEVLPDSYQVHPVTGVVQTQQLGNKLRAYSLNTEPSNQSYLEAYLLSEEEQQQYALDISSLSQLIALIQQLVFERSDSFALEWTFCQLLESSQLQLYLTQFSSHSRKQGSRGVVKSEAPSMSHAPHPMPYAPSPFLKGISASPGRAIALAHVVAGSSQHLQAIPSGKILVTKSFAPDWLPLLKRAAGVVAERGGLTSHAAIIARELGIPAIIGATDATRLIQTGESLLIDGEKGEIHRLLEEQGSREAEEGTSEEQSTLLTPNSPLLATQLMLNLSQPSSIASAATLPIDGVGLLRSELMMLELLESQPLIWWLQPQQKSVLVEHLRGLISQFAAAFTPRPVYYRSTDWRSHEFSSLTEQKPEGNPLLGQRGTFKYCLDPALFDLELEALAQVQSDCYTNVNLILPFVRSVEEFTFCRDRVKQVGLTQQSSFRLWIMAEVPSVLFLLPEYVRAGVQGISIGTNDLTQLLLGVDREQASLATAFNDRHPALLEATKQLIKLARGEEIPCSICGQAAQSPELIDKLVQWGITSISVEPEAVERTHWAITRAEHRLILEAARRQLGS